jgi:hypothetical protein
VLDEDRWRAIGDERRLAAQHLVPEDAERVEVASAVDRALARRLFRAHVSRRSDGDSGGGQPRFAVTDSARDAEVSNHWPAAVGVDQDVVGLDVAVDDSALMGVSERIRDVTEDSPRLVNRERTVVVQQLRDIVARDVRHHKENDAACLVDGVNIYDVRVVELRGHLGLAQKPGLDFAAERQFGWQYFDGDRALQTPIFGAIDDPHAAASDLAVQLVVGTERTLDERAQLIIRLR